MNYQIEENDTILDIKNDNVVITINSLLQLINIPDEEFFNYIVYIDEIASFLECCTHNSLLYNIINLFNKLLLKIVKNTHKIIVSDALINECVFNY